jgi:hypothetical protein
MTEDEVVVSLRIKARHEIEIGKHHIPGWNRDGYFPVWRRPITEGRNIGCIDVIQFESYRSEPPGPMLRWVTESKHDIGIYRLVKEADKWYVELLEEAPLQPERLSE